MNVELLRTSIGWCAVLNIGLLTGWFGFFWLGHDLMYRFHSRLFRISVERFDAIHYAMMGIFKIAVFSLNLVPYLVLRFLV